MPPPLPPPATDAEARRRSFLDRRKAGHAEDARAGRENPFAPSASRPRREERGRGDEQPPAWDDEASAPRSAGTDIRGDLITGLLLISGGAVWLLIALSADRIPYGAIVVIVFGVIALGKAAVSRVSG
jgi:hypothetical protein